MSGPIRGKDPNEALAKKFATLSQEQRTQLRKSLRTRQSSGFELVAKTLSEAGITHIYGVSGLPTQNLLPACEQQNIRPIGVYHQTSAVCMALAQNYQAGKLVACALTSAGPAATNTITGLLVAHDNNWPVIVLGGQRTSFQKFDAIPLIRDVTKKAYQVDSTSKICPTISEACEMAVSGRPGPVYVQLHENAMDGLGTQDLTNDTFQPQETVVSDSDVKKIVSAAISAKRPALLLGEGIRWSVKVEELKELIELLKLPFITSPMGRGFVQDDHSLCFNQSRTALQAGADFVLILGGKLNWVFRHGSEMSRTAQVFHIDYAGNDDDNAVVARKFIEADPGKTVSQLLAAVKNCPNENETKKRKTHTAQWHYQLRKVSHETQKRLNERLAITSKGPMSPFRMMKEIRDALPREAICVTEGNISMMIAQQVIPAFTPGGRMDAGTSACMGVGVPFGIGAKVACPDRPVVVIAGDYGFSLSAMELEVCVRHRIPILVIVANNQGNNGAVKQKEFFPSESSELVTMFLPGLEYDRIMKMFGGNGTTISNPNELKRAIEDAIKAGLPACINVLVDPYTPLPNAWGEQPPHGPKK